jgi:LacI family transcriptional regulator
LLKGAARAVHGSGYELIVYAGGHSGPEKAGWERRHLSRLGGTLTDGIVLVTPEVLDVDVDTLTPVVAVDPHVGASSFPTVASDSLTGAMAATEYLISLGHRRIGHLSGRPDLRSSELREQGYRRALDEAGIPFDPNLVRVGGYDPDTALRPARELLALPDRPTAIFAANDVSAIQTMNVARDLGIAVPESVLAEPALTTIDHAIQDQGYEAALMLIRLIDEPGTGQTDVRLPTQLVIRQSCRAV